MHKGILILLGTLHLTACGSQGFAPIPLNVTEGFKSIETAAKNFESESQKLAASLPDAETMQRTSQVTEMISQIQDLLSTQDLTYENLLANAQTMKLSELPKISGLDTDQILGEIAKLRTTEEVNKKKK